MEILQKILSFFLQEYGGEKLAPLLRLLSENSFNLKSLLNSLNFEQVFPLVKDLFAFNEKNNPTETVGYKNGLKPIAFVADKDIVYSLNQYFYQMDYS